MNFAVNNPVAGASPGSLPFGSQNVGTTSPSQPVTLSNTGSGVLTIAGIGTTANFGQTNNCGSSLAAGASCTINVTFIPSVPGALTGTLTITDNSNGVAGSNQTVNLTGTGSPAFAVVLNPTSVLGGVPSTATVNLADPAPTGGAVVTLSSNNTAAATVPASVTVAAGTSTKTFTVTTFAVASSTAVSISISYNSAVKAATLSVKPATVSSLTLSPSSVIGGTSSMGTVTLTGAAPTAGTVVTLLAITPRRPRFRPTSR